jgi:hypothetical protein
MLNYYSIKKRKEKKKKQKLQYCKRCQINKKNDQVTDQMFYVELYQTGHLKKNYKCMSSVTEGQ